MKFTPVLLFTLLFSCGENVEDRLMNPEGSSDKIPNQENEEAEKVEEEIPAPGSSLRYDGEWLQDVNLFYCQIGIYQSPALLVIEEEITDEINGDGDFAAVKGYYFYIKNQKDLTVSGGLDIINGQYSLEESYKGKQTGFMQFSTIGYGENYWAISEEDADQQEFNFTPIEPKNPESRKFQLKKQKYTETHEVMDMSAEVETWEEVEDRLAMVFIDEDKMIFDYHVVRTNFHTGGASGLAVKNDLQNYVWLGEEGCELTFIVEENSVDVIDNGCDYYHGARATLDGSYSK